MTYNDIARAIASLERNINYYIIGPYYEIISNHSKIIFIYITDIRSSDLINSTVQKTVRGWKIPLEEYEVSMMWDKCIPR